MHFGEVVQLGEIFVNGPAILSVSWKGCAGSEQFYLGPSKSQMRISFECYIAPSY